LYRRATGGDRDDDGRIHHHQRSELEFQRRRRLTRTAFTDLTFGGARRADAARPSIDRTIIDLNDALKMAE
jgi:hypothetical protein